jgi:hypothetical protein
MRQDWRYLNCATLLICLSALGMSSCSLVQSNVESLPESDAELMAAIAKLAKQGSRGVCNPSMVEESLGILIRDSQVKRNDFNLTEGAKYEISTSIMQKNGRTVFDDSAYVRHLSPEVSKCRIAIKLNGERMCDRTSGQMTKLMGVMHKVSPTNSHSTSGGSVTYSFYFDSKLTVVALGDVTAKCGNFFAIDSEGTWK